MGSLGLTVDLSGGKMSWSEDDLMIGWVNLDAGVTDIRLIEFAVDRFHFDHLRRDFPLASNLQVGELIELKSGILVFIASGRSSQYIPLRVHFFGGDPSNFTLSTAEVSGGPQDKTYTAYTSRPVNRVDYVQILSA